MASRAPVDQSLLADLVERRIEAPEVEYKSWMQLTTKVERAKIARHLCALANSGGGWLVFGFDDDGKPSEPHPADLGAYSQDMINGIGERYLEPQPHCAVHRVTAQSGREYPVVRVPPHGDVPVCAKADGPQENGKPQGILSGVHYVRAPGPRSVPINTPELWRDVIRRCVVAERATLLSSISQLFDGPQTAPDEPKLLNQWVDDALATWAKLEAVWPVPIAANLCAFGFQLLGGDGRPPAALPLDALQRAIRDASSAARDVVPEGAPFDIGWDSRASVALPLERDAYEHRDLPSAERRYHLPVLWRISVDGLGVEITGIPEDNPWVQEAVEGKSTRSWRPGHQLAPSFQADTIVQHLAFVRALAKSFPGASRCELTVDYAGLAGREVGEPSPGAYFSLVRRSQVDARRVPVSVGLAALDAELPEVAGLLIEPVFRLFDGWGVGADYIRSRLEGRA